MTVTVTTASPDETRALGAAVAAVLDRGDVIVLSGGLGSGKTTFAQGAIAALGVTEPVISPTYALVKEYQARLCITHVDAYRIDRLAEVFDLGFEEIVDETKVAFIEWGEKVAQVLPEERLTAHFELTPDLQGRIVVLTAHGPRWFARLETLSELGDPLGKP